MSVELDNLRAIAAMMRKNYMVGVANAIDEAASTIEQLEKNYSELAQQIHLLNEIRVDAPGGALKMINWWDDTGALLDKHKEE